MDFETFLKKEILEQLENNSKELISYIDTPDGKKKINSLKSKNPDLDFSNLKEEILKGNSYAIALIRKDPIKQNISEKAFFKYTGIEKLPQSGNNAIRIGNSKAADFKIGEWLGSQKYIQEAGGSQDNQIMDLILFATNCLKKNKKTIICVDGEYGKRKIAEKFNFIKEKYKNYSDCIITYADELKEGIENGRFK